MTDSLPYTPKMLKQFDRITLDTCSLNQVKRINGRIALKMFIEKHGKDVCDIMFKELQRRDAKRKSR